MKMEKYLIIGDIHGRFEELLELVRLAKVPFKNIYLLGDLIDRGEKSLEVIEWAMENNIKTILGNHDHMFLCYNNTQAKNAIVSKWDLEKMRLSYTLPQNGSDKFLNKWLLSVPFPKKQQIIKWISNLPTEIILGDYYLSHAPYRIKEQFETFEDYNFEKLWAYPFPYRCKGKISIHGHCGYFAEFLETKSNFEWDNKNKYGYSYTHSNLIGNLHPYSKEYSILENLKSICIDSEQDGKLMGVILVGDKKENVFERKYISIENFK